MAVLMPHSAFIHVPKTGGTWCRAAIKAGGIPHHESGPNVPRMITRGHASVSRAYPTIIVRNWTKGDLRPAKRLIFGFVRNPLGYLESRWADAIRKYKGIAVPNIDRNWNGVIFSLNFAEYAESCVTADPGAPSCAMRPRLGFDRSGDSWVPQEHSCDEIGRTENLADDLVRILKKAGEKFNEQKLRAVKPQRVSSRLPGFQRQIVWTDEQREKIYTANKYLCDTYGYKL